MCCGRVTCCGMVIRVLSYISLNISSPHFVKKGKIIMIDQDDAKNLTRMGKLAETLNKVDGLGWEQKGYSSQDGRCDIRVIATPDEMAKVLPALGAMGIGGSNGVEPLPRSDEGLKAASENAFAMMKAPKNHCPDTGLRFYPHHQYSDGTVEYVIGYNPAVAEAYNSDGNPIDTAIKSAESHYKDAIEGNFESNAAAKIVAARLPNGR